MLFVLNYITIKRLVIFIIILLIIYIYKLLIERIKRIKLKENIYLLLILLNMDKIKLIILNIIIQK